MALAWEPANVKVIHAHEFVRARPGGVLDLETSEVLLFDVEAFTSYEEAISWLSGEEA